MTSPLYNRHLLTLTHHTRDEVNYLLELSHAVKAAKRAGRERQLLRGKNIALIFEKTSTRTRCAFEVAAADQGAHTTYLGPTGSQIGAKESIPDTARVLGRMYDAIEYRGFGQERVEALAEYAGVPVFNGLTDEYHPTQMIADIMTIQEHYDGPLTECCLVYLGDGRNNMANSLLLIGAKLGMDIRIAAPRELQPEQQYVELARREAAESGARVTVSDDVAACVKGADFLYTDVWVSMGEPPEEWQRRIDLLTPYRIDAELVAATGNPQVKVMHCLPAYHDLGTEVGRQVAAQHPRFSDGIEISHEVFESARSIVFDEAENRMHSIKAIMVASLSAEATPESVYSD
ncbi:ornithine carbamoyltransferase [Dermabacteraceae bacterium TAE3-ERU27]|nr:ornithine carbamoyltransferase [Dermabacteraceae bacterium TAE3-ERU27]